MGYQKRDPIFYCDCCSKTFPNGQGLIDLEIPVRKYDEKGESYLLSFKKVALCKDCLDRFWEASDANFAVVEVGLTGTKFYPHFETQSDPYGDLRWVGMEEKKEDIKS